MNRRRWLSAAFLLAVFAAAFFFCDWFLPSFPIRTIHTAGPAVPTHFSPHGRWLATHTHGNKDISGFTPGDYGTLELWNVETGERIAKHSTDAFISLGFSENERTWLVHKNGRGPELIWHDLVENSEVKPLPPQDFKHHIRILQAIRTDGRVDAGGWFNCSSDSNLLLTNQSASQRGFEVIDPKTGAVILLESSNVDFVIWPMFTPDGTTIIGVKKTSPSTLEHWSPKTGKSIKNLKMPESFQGNFAANWKDGDQLIITERNLPANGSNRPQFHINWRSGQVTKKEIAAHEWHEGNTDYFVQTVPDPGNSAARIQNSANQWTCRVMARSANDRTVHVGSQSVRSMYAPTCYVVGDKQFVAAASLSNQNVPEWTVKLGEKLPILRPVLPRPYFLSVNSWTKSANGWSRSKEIQLPAPGRSDFIEPRFIMENGRALIAVASEGEPNALHIYAVPSVPSWKVRLASAISTTLLAAIMLFVALKIVGFCSAVVRNTRSNEGHGEE